MIASGQPELFAERWEVCINDASTVRVIFSIHRHGDDHEVCTVNIPRHLYEIRKAETLAGERDRMQALVH